MSHEPIFQTFVLQLWALGLDIIPCGGKDGKRPLVSGFGDWKRIPSEQTINKWRFAFADANIGLLCGLSFIVVVDVDDPELELFALKRFGDTPLISRTPSGGLHLWYRAGGFIRSQNLRAKEGLAIDIKAAGGLVIVPPSVRPDTDVCYYFERGSWDAVESLPRFNPLSLPRRAG